MPASPDQIAPCKSCWVNSTTPKWASACCSTSARHSRNGSARPPLCAASCGHGRSSRSTSWPPCYVARGCARAAIEAAFGGALTQRSAWLLPVQACCLQKIRCGADPFSSGHQTHADRVVAIVRDEHIPSAQAAPYEQIKHFLPKRKLNRLGVAKAPNDLDRSCSKRGLRRKRQQLVVAKEVVFALIFGNVVLSLQRPVLADVKTKCQSLGPAPLHRRGKGILLGAIA